MEGDEILDVLRQIGITTETYFHILSHYKKATQLAMEPPKQKKEDQVDIPRLSSKAIVVLEHLLVKTGFAMRSNLKNIKDYYLAVVKKTRFFRGQKTWDTSFNLWCMNPAVAFEDVINLARCIVLTSGTLAPMMSFESELGVPFPLKFEAPHVINVKEQTWIANISRGVGDVQFEGTFSSSNSMAFQDDLGRSILEIVRLIEYGVLCFFPSYKFLEKVVQRWKQTGTESGCMYD